VTLRRSLLFAFAVALFSWPLLAEQTEPVMHLKGFGSTTDQLGPFQGFEPSISVEVVITRFSSDDERDHFVAGGIPALAGMPSVGYVKAAGNPARAIRYAGQEPLDSNTQLTKLTLITDYVILVPDPDRGMVGGAKKAAAYSVTLVSLVIGAQVGSGLLGGSGSLGGTRNISYDPIAKRIICSPSEGSIILTRLHQVPK
jgi:hypothetical protein